MEQLFRPPVVPLHSSPKETQVFCSCLSLGEECTSFNFIPKVICRMLLVTICQRPHFKIPHDSRTVIRCLSTSHHRKITKLDSSSKFGSCISFWEECISVNCGSCQDHLTKYDMTLDHGRNPRGTVKNWQI